MTCPVEKTIESLCKDLKPCKCQGNPLWRSLLWMLLALGYTFAVVMAIGARDHVMDKIMHEHFLFEIGLAFSIGISASLVTFWLSIPDCGRYKPFMTVPITLFFVQIFWMLDRLLIEGMGEVRPNWFSNCWVNTLMIATVPAIAVVLLVRKGATTMPCMLAVNAVLAVSSFAWLGSRFICNRDNVAEAYLVNFLPYVIFGIVAGLLGRRIFRW